MAKRTVVAGVALCLALLLASSLSGCKKDEIASPPQPAAEGTAAPLPEATSAVVELPPAVSTAGGAEVPSGTATTPPSAPDATQGSSAAVAIADKGKAKSRVTAFMVAFVTATSSSLADRDAKIAVLATPDLANRIAAGEYGPTTQELSAFVAGGGWSRNVRVTGVTYTANAGEHATLLVRYTYDTYVTEGETIGPATVKDSLSVGMRADYVIDAIY